MKPDMLVALSEQGSFRIRSLCSRATVSLPDYANTGRFDGVTALRCNRQRRRHVPRSDG